MDEAHGIGRYPLYARTKATIDDLAKKAKHIEAFAIHVEGREVYTNELFSIGRVDDTVECRSGGILQRLVPEPGSGTLDQLVQRLIARTRLKGLSNPGAEPTLLRKMEDALEIVFAKPWCRIELKRKGITGRMTRG